MTSLVDAGATQTHKDSTDGEQAANLGVRFRSWYPLRHLRSSRYGVA